METVIFFPSIILPFIQRPAFPLFDFHFFFLHSMPDNLCIQHTQIMQTIHLVSCILALMSLLVFPFPTG